jgi:integrase
MPSISEKIVAGLEPKLDNRGKPRASTLHYFSGATLQGKKAPAGFAVRVTAAGTKAFVLFHRKEGKGYLETLGRWDENSQGGSLTVRDAIVKADKLVKDFAKGNREDPRPERTRRLQDGDKPEGLTVGAMLDMFIERYARKDAKLRTADQIASTFERLVKPEIGDYGIYEIRRSHIADMLDEIADESGPVMADRTLAYFRKACNWYAARDDEFNSPIVRGMSRNATESRARILADDEIRDLWAALEGIKDVPACYPRYVKTLLFTATRRNEAAQMSAAELDGDLWTIPAARYKTGIDHTVPLSAAARDIIGDVDGGYAFSSDGGKRAFGGFSKSKRELDRTITEIRERDGRGPMARFTLHDLRRTARSLMSRAGIPADIAERCLGHVIPGVRGVYDRHEYEDKKRDAFEKLAGLVALILNPQPNVTPMRRAKA